MLDSQQTQALSKTAQRGAVVASARDCALRGWQVFPAHGLRQGRCTCGTLKCPNAGKHPATVHGFHDATTEPAAIHAWWSKLPDANLAVATGAVSGLFVLDVDPRHGGDESLNDLVREHGQLPRTVTVLTGGGGQHYYFTHPGHYVKSHEMKPGLDIKADGGYVIAPPSLHASGGRYDWEIGCAPEEVALSPAPKWLLHSLTTLAPQQVAEMPSAIPEGARNRTLASLAGTMRRRGMTYEEINAALMAVNDGRCQPPLNEETVREIAKSVSRYAPMPFPTTIERRARARSRAMR